MERDNVNQKSMAEYIDREALRDALYEADAITMRGVAILNQFPAADVVPVRHGRWITRHKWDWFVCSCCSLETSNATNYCPICGAEMDGDEE